ncbi:MAG: hypothetical protein SGBAC_000373 [Bacillariaceae sp.]
MATSPENQAHMMGAPQMAPHDLGVDQIPPHQHGMDAPHPSDVSAPPAMEFPDMGRAVQPVPQSQVLPPVMMTAPQMPQEHSPEQIEAHDSLKRSAPSNNSRKPPPKKPRRDSREGRMSWNDSLFELLKFKAEHGHTDVPEDHPIYFWVYTQRKNKRQKEWRQQHNKPENPGTRKLTDDHIRVLNTVEFCWDPYKKSIAERWKQRFDELVIFKEQHGHTNVPQKSNARGLSSWVKVQRMNYTHAQKQKQGEKLASEHCVALSQERIHMLNSIGFEWRVKKVAQGWDARFNQLLEYKSINGDTLVPFNYVNEHGRLGRWVNKQRHEKTLKLRGEKSQLTDEREHRLDEIGFRWVAPGFQKKTVKEWANPHDGIPEAHPAHAVLAPPQHNPTPVGMPHAPHHMHHDPQGQV